jgi:DNA N-6-adenine-methyltransferase (Dam)
MTLGSHQATVGKSQVHITPKWIIDRLGPFELDPCAADPRPWDCAIENRTSDGLSQPWRGRVWLDPPFDRYEVGKWIERLADHGHGTTLLHARTEAGWFEPRWRSASAILFMADRIKFSRQMTEQQRLAIRLAADLGVDPKEIDHAIALARTGRIDLIVAVTARDLTLKAALKEAARSNSPRNPSRTR